MVFRVPKADAKGGHGITQFGRALSELNIEILCANSSQAKGRVERVNRTLQDRLVKEPRLAGITGITAGNEYLSDFMQRFNARIADARAAGTAGGPGILLARAGIAATANDGADIGQRVAQRELDARPTRPAGPGILQRVGTNATLAAGDVQIKALVSVVMARAITANR